ncbi:MAG: hypothetical protein WCF84_05520 [Anaerolineae bacterium]
MAQIYTNETLIENRSRLGRYASLGGLAIIVGGLVASFQENILLAYGALILGFIISNIGAYYLNRWGLHPYKKVTEGIKGLGKQYSLYNYYLPIPNVLLTPYSVVVLLLKNQDGKITANAKGWRQGSSFLGFFRALSSEGIGNPPQELELEKDKMKKFLADKLGENVKVPVEGYILFTNPQASIKIDGVDAPIIVLSQQPDALKDALRRDKRTPLLSEDLYDKIVQLFAVTAEEAAAEAEKGFKFWQR